MFRIDAPTQHSALSVHLQITPFLKVPDPSRPMVVIGQFSTPEEAAEHGLVFSNRFKTLRLFQEIFGDWEPWWQAMPINHAGSIAGLAGCIPGALFAFKLRCVLYYS